MKTYILLFTISKFDRNYLDRLSDSELYKAAVTHKDKFSMIYDLSSFCDDCNSMTIDINQWWMYPVTK